MSGSDNRKGEVHELRVLLQNPKTRDPVRLKAVVEKVIAYMTLGIDVSPLFTDMIMATNTKDLVQKKMVYFYLCSYADQNSDLALLAINTLQKDCGDADPMVRGLALRSLCSLSVQKLVEYILIPIRNGLSDSAAYVRKTAILGCAKLHSLNPIVFRDSDLLEELYNKIRDRDSEVVVNTIYALNEILSDEGGMAINKKIIYHLVNRLHLTHVWGQCAVLNLLSSYTPSSTEEMFDLMNALEDRLRHSNPAVVLAATKVFLVFTQSISKVHEDVLERVQAPLLTMCSSSNDELSFSVLNHIAALVKRSSGLFFDQFKHFYIRFNDPICNQLLKLDILTYIADSDNAAEILEELSEYVTGMDDQITRKTIKTIGIVPALVPGIATEAIKHLLAFLDIGSEIVTTEAVISLKNLLRRFPERHFEILPGVHKSLKHVEEPEGKISVIWMIGEYGDVIDDAPYMLEKFVDPFPQESATVQTEILTAALKLFFKRPPEVYNLLSTLFSKATHDSTAVNVRDKALFYYRLLQSDVHEAAHIVNCIKVEVYSLHDGDDPSALARILEDFNSLSIVYGKTPEKFTHIVLSEEEDGEEEDKDSFGEPPRIQGPDDQVNLLSMDFLGTNEHFKEESNEDDMLDLILRASVTCNPSDFQTRWGSFPCTTSLDLSLPKEIGYQMVEDICFQMNLHLMASGKVGEVHKSYYFGQVVCFFTRSLTPIGNIRRLDFGRVCI